MEEVRGQGSWRETIQENLEFLTNCTKLTSEMVNHLRKENLITASEKHNLMNHAVSEHERASDLYDKITKKWDDEGFLNFKVALEKGGNSQALKIISNGNANVCVNPDRGLQPEIGISEQVCEADKQLQMMCNRFNKVLEVNGMRPQMDLLLANISRLEFTCTDKETHLVLEFTPQKEVPALEILCDLLYAMERLEQKLRELEHLVENLRMLKTKHVENPPIWTKQLKPTNSSSAAKVKTSPTIREQTVNTEDKELKQRQRNAKRKQNHILAQFSLFQFIMERINSMSREAKTFTVAFLVMLVVQLNFALLATDCNFQWTGYEGKSLFEVDICNQYGAGRYTGSPNYDRCDWETARVEYCQPSPLGTVKWSKGCPELHMEEIMSVKANTAMTSVKLDTRAGSRES